MNDCAFPRVIFIDTITCILTVLVLTSCASSNYRSPSSIPKSIPSSHVWQYLHSYGEEQIGYATYSYVLVGRDQRNQNSTSLYYELVKEIQASTVSVEEFRNISPAGLLNLFIIPIIPSKNDEHISPNYHLSKSILVSLSTTSPMKFSRPGPYIITLYEPIGSGDGNGVADILYMDLTNAHPKAIPEIVRTYQEKVIESNLYGVEKLNSLRLSLLNVALHTEDSIGFAKSAYASMRDAFAEP